MLNVPDAEMSWAAPPLTRRLVRLSLVVITIVLP